MAAQLFNTPILFLIFNRPETTKQVFQKIREIRPQLLFVSADGPRLDKKDELRRCEETRRVIKNIDWDCTVKTNFSDKNLGCKVGVSSGINWFFDNVSEGIILEDDCVPDLSFFHFCETLLHYYRNDERIMHIGGVNLQDGVQRGTDSYYFSKINHIWGWATWKRAWDSYDVNISAYAEVQERNLLRQLYPDAAMRRFWKRNFDLVYKELKDTWDFQWVFTMAVQNGLAILPNKNLISNIGYDMHATHTIDSFHTLANRPTEQIGDIHHPPFILPDVDADKYTFRKYMNPNKFKKLWQFLRRTYAGRQRTPADVR